MAGQTRDCNMPSKIDVDPLLVALFDLPPDVQVSSKNNGRLDANTTGTPSRSRVRRSRGGRNDSGVRRNPPDDGVETDTSLLHGESISLTDEEYLDAVAVAQEEEESPFGNNNRPSSFTTFRPNMVSLPVRLSASKTPDQYDAPGGRSSPPLFGVDSQHDTGIRVSVSECPDQFVAHGGKSSPLLGSQTQHHSMRIPKSVGSFSDECVTHHAGAGRMSPPLGSSTNTMEHRSSNKQNSPKKKKKKKSSPIKSFKKLVGRKSKSASTVLTMSSSFDEADSLIGSPNADVPHSYVGDSESSPHTPQHMVNDSLSPERLGSLKSKIERIRSTIHSLEGDIIATRNELARAHQHLHLATIEIADMQREALEAEVGLSNFMQQQGGVSISPPASALRLSSPLHFFEAEGSEFGMSSRSRSTCSDHLHFFTPTSSLIESEEDSDCFTPRSQPSFDSLLSLNERVSFSTPIFNEAVAGVSNGEKDKTPLTRNSKSKRKRSFKFDRGGKLSNSLTHGMVSNKETNSIGTPSTAGSTQEEAPMAQMNGKTERSPRVNLFRMESFIRAHDLALTDDKSSLLPLHETNVSDVVNALFEKGFEFAMDESERWSPESNTGKILSKHATKMMNEEIDGPMGKWPNAAYGDDVLVWTSKCPHDGHGSQYPVMKARGIIPTSASKLVRLLLDSGRVQQYNKMSLGRIDEHCFAEGVDRLSKCSVTGIQGEAKIVRSKSQPPVIRKPVELRLLLHAQRLPSGSEEGAKYLIIGRSVWETEHGTAEATDNSTTRCEMLLSVNLIRDIQISGCCEITTITHGVSPGIPVSIGKRIGLAAAAKYIRDIRAVFEKHE